MHIENVDCFRGWLIQAVTPICDANPQHLARYVIALVKKDKPTNELMRSLHDNLDVFLQEKTKAFVSKLFEVIADKTYESYPPVEDKELEKKSKGDDAARPAADSAHPSSGRSSQGEHKSAALHSGGSKVTTDVREKRKSVEEESKHYTRGAGSPPKSHTRRDEQNGTSSRKPESDLQGRSGDSDKSQSDDRLRSRIEREGIHERSAKGSWKRPSSPQGRNMGIWRLRSQEDEQKRHRSLERGSAECTSPVPIRNPESERNVGSHQASDRGRQLNEYQHESLRRSRATHPTRSPVPRRMLQPKERVGSHTSSLDRTGHIRKRSRSAARSSSRSPSARSDSSRSSLESFSSKCSASKRAHVDKDPVVNSRSSTPFDENADRSGDMYCAVPRDMDRSAVPHPRCQDYDEKGFCIRGDQCPFDHGSDPYIVDESQFAKVLPFQGGVSIGLANGGISQDQVRRPLVPSHPNASVLPNVSRPPPPFLLRPMHPPPHYITSHGMPPPAYYRPSLPVQAGRPDVYIPPPADAYLPEPYKPKIVRGYRATSVKSAAAAAGLDKSSDAWHAMPDTHSSYQQQQQRFSSSQVPVGRHANLVRVPTQEDEGSTEKTQVNAVTNVHAGLKRKASDLDHESQPAYPAAEAETIIVPPVKKTALDHPGVRQNSSHANKTLEMRKIPRDQNTIANINNHFSKFGTIINLQVGWEGDPQAALVSFASSAQASAAYRSQEPFLNNRFIKIFWHNSEKQQQQPTEPQQPNVASQPTESQQLQPKRHVFPQRHQLQLNNRLTKTRQQLPNLDVTAVQALNSEVSKPHSKPASDVPATDLRPTHEVSLTKIQRRSSKDFTAKAALTKKIEEVTQQSQLLLSKYVNEQKALFEKLEKDKATMGVEDRTSIIQTIKKLAAKIEEVKSTMSAVPKPVPAEPRPKVVHPTVPRGSLRKVNVRRFSGSGKSSPGVSASSSQLSLAQSSIFQDKQHAQKAILDTELELMTCQKEGHDADELRKRVMALKEEATSLGIFNSPGQGRGIIRGRGRGAHSVGRRWAVPRYRANPLTVDRRPKQLLVTGFQPEEKDELISHIMSFGALDSHSFDMTVPSLLVSFKSRIVAEKVAAEGCTFKGKKLTMVWQKSVLSELNASTEQENMGAAIKQLVHTDLKMNATGENVPNRNKPIHAIVPRPELEEDHKSEETDPKYLCSVDLQNQDTAATAEDDNSELLGLDEEDDDDDEEERPWRR